jgi:hypothetical protein
MSAALRQALRVVQQEAPQLANLRSVRTSAAPKGYHYVSAIRAPAMGRWGRGRERQQAVHSLPSTVYVARGLVGVCSGLHGICLAP